jgi:hypothetical protein
MKGYETKQHHGYFSWCVDVNGKKLTGIPVVWGAENLECPANKSKNLDYPS